jgi:hypothetical protein
MRVVYLLIAAVPLFAQEEGPIGILRGDAIGREGTTLDGSIVLKSADQHEYRCHYDNYSYLERDGDRIGPIAIKTGDHLEIVADHKPGSTTCYARSIHVLLGSLPVNPGYRIRQQRRTVADQIFPRGNIAQAGVIVRLTPQLIVLHTRHDGEQTFLLRQDTRYLDSGVLADFSKLGINLRVSVRAGKNLDDVLEVFQVIWGQIEGPK